MTLADSMATIDPCWCLLKPCGTCSIARLILTSVRNTKPCGTPLSRPRDLLDEFVYYLMSLYIICRGGVWGTGGCTRWNTWKTTLDETGVNWFYHTGSILIFQFFLFLPNIKTTIFLPGRPHSQTLLSLLNGQGNNPMKLLFGSIVWPETDKFIGGIGQLIMCEVQIYKHMHAQKSEIDFLRESKAIFLLKSKTHDLYNSSSYAYGWG